MSGIQGIIVCGEASESEEEEEFCQAQALGHRASEIPRISSPLDEQKQDAYGKQQQPLQNQQLQRKKVASSLLHQKLWETHTSLEKNLCRALQEPLMKKATQMSSLTASIPAAQTCTLSANAAFSQVSVNLSHIDVLLQGLRQVSALDTLK